MLEEHRRSGAARVGAGAHGGKEQEFEIGKETRPENAADIVCKRMIQAALVWLCSLAKTESWRSSLSVSGDDKRQPGKVTGLRRVVAAAAPWK